MAKFKPGIKKKYSKNRVRARLTVSVKVKEVG